MELLLPRRGGPVCAAWLEKRCATTWRGRGIGQGKQMQQVEGRTGQNNRNQVPELKGSEKLLDSSCPCHPNLHMDSTPPKGPSPQHDCFSLSFWGVHSTGCESGPGQELWLG